MTLFSSREPFNDDPEPWTDYWERSAEQWAPGDVYAPRPKYDRPQHNPTNPILTEFRKYNEGRTVWLARHWTKEHNWPEMVLSDLSDDPLGTPQQEEHAYKVLTRLANLSN